METTKHRMEAARQRRKAASYLFVLGSLADEESLDVSEKYNAVAASPSRAKAQRLHCPSPLRVEMPVMTAFWIEDLKATDDEARR